MAWTSPRTWVSGEVPTAAILNAHVRDNLKAIGDPWTAWSPTVTAETGTFTSVSGAGRYMSAGKLTIWSLTITITTAGTAAGAVRFGLPVTAQASGVYMGGGRESASTGVALTVFGASTTLGSVLRYDNATIIASGRTLMLAGTYEAA